MRNLVQTTDFGLVGDGQIEAMNTPWISIPAKYNIADPEDGLVPFTAWSISTPAQRHSSGPVEMGSESLSKMRSKERIPDFSVSSAAIFFSAVSAGGGRLPDRIESIDLRLPAQVTQVLRLRPRPG